MWCRRGELTLERRTINSLVVEEKGSFVGRCWQVGRCGDGSSVGEVPFDGFSFLSNIVIDINFLKCRSADAPPWNPSLC